MTLGFIPLPAMPPPAADSVPRQGRTLEPAEWAAAGIPLLRDPRDIVTGLYDRHRPARATAVVAVLDAEQRVIASASLTRREPVADGWDLRNALLGRLRRIIPHDLRRRTPVRTAVLLHCRDGEAGWTEEDGAWMWGLRDACTLHGLRCGAYITLTGSGWQVLGEDRGGRHPHSCPQPAAAPEQVPEQASRNGGSARGRAATGHATNGRSTDAGGVPEAQSRTAVR